MNNRHLWQLKKSKSLGPFWSYQLNSTANLAHLPQNWAHARAFLALIILDVINCGFLTTETNSKALYIFHGFHQGSTEGWFLELGRTY